MTIPQLQMGHIVYIVSNKDQKIIPAVVQEEIVHRTMQGETLSYKVAVGPRGGQKVIDLAKIDGEVYSSLEEVRQSMTQRLVDFVNKMCDGATERSRQWYGETDMPALAPDSGDKINPSALLGEVTMAQQPKPESAQAAMLALHVHSPSAPVPVQKEQLRQRLRENLTIPEEIPQEGLQTVMPDGTVHNVKVNMNG